jgi:hypothetical protein
MNGSDPYVKGAVIAVKGFRYMPKKNVRVVRGRQRLERAIMAASVIVQEHWRSLSGINNYAGTFNRPGPMLVSWFQRNGNKSEPRIFFSADDVVEVGGAHRKVCHDDYSPVL